MKKLDGFVHEAAPIYKSDEFFKSTPLVDQIYLDMTAVAHRTGVAPFGIRSQAMQQEWPQKLVLLVSDQ